MEALDSASLQGGPKWAFHFDLRHSSTGMAALPWMLRACLASIASCSGTGSHFCFFRMTTMLLALLIATGFTYSHIAAQECFAPAKTLTTTCGNDNCGAYEPCVVYNATDCSNNTNSSSNAGKCTSNLGDVCGYTCFQAFGAYTSDPTQFVFLVPFDDQNEMSDGIYATASNGSIAAIDQLTLSPRTTNVWIQGGDMYQQINRGQMVELELADNFLTSQTQVTSVGLVAMNLSTKVSDVHNFLPSSTKALSLINTQLTEFPSHLESLANVVNLYLNDNYIVKVNSSVSWEKLVVLDLHQNGLTMFEGNFPGLTQLYLHGNNLTEIPAVVFTFQHLTKLSMQRNPLTTRTFTEAQIMFLQGLANLDLADDDFENSVDCSLSEQKTVGTNNVVVCVSELKAGSISSAASTSAASSTFSSASRDLPTPRISYSSRSSSIDSDQVTSGADQTSSLLIVTIVAAFIVLVAAIVTALYYCKQHRREKANGVYNNMQRASSKRRALAMWNDPELLELQVECDEIQDICLIGDGTFSVVWLVRYRNSVLLTSKRLREDASVTKRTQAFVEEIKLVSLLDHPNIATFIGAAWSSGPDIQALFEFVENGDLCSYLVPSLPRYWTRIKLQLAVDVIEALVYIHALTPSLTHGNLRSSKVLISADMQAKLIDFGANRTTMTGIGTSRWCAPEIVSGSSDYDQAADIFAFGVLLSEFDTHELPYDDVVDNNGNKLEDAAILQKVAGGSLRPTFSETCPPIVLELAKQCMSHTPRDRPPALKIAYALRTLQREAFNM